jgi:hypothetical protein
MMNSYFSRGRSLQLASAGAGVAAVLLASACSSSGSSSTSSGLLAGSAASGVAWSQCVRAHGVPNFPDPDGSGQVPKETAQQLGVSDSVLGTATNACANLNPNNPASPQTAAQVVTNGLQVARCMRAHGLPDFPDPTTGSSGAHFVISVSADGFNPNDPQVIAKARACQAQLPPGSQLPQVTVTS